MIITLIDRISQDEPDEVRAVLDLAFSADEFTEPAFDRILAAFAPAYADEIRRIADDLRWADRFRGDPPREVLAAYGVRPFGDPDTLCDSYGAAKEADALLAAQIVASLMQQRPVRQAS